nr:PREDICTED: uncharacterized protein LOC102353469 isoform X1 [Latimeria chalumnae]|eukprot:XP_014345235.1 PREDICTED: uncharacterized protein LOC102353469 isoform X1 [Latimeria chalumnae]
MLCLLHFALGFQVLMTYRLQTAFSAKARESHVEAGTEVNIPCDLSGTILCWTWQPRYPVCAGVGTGESTPTIIYTVSANGESRADLLQFDRRLILKGDHKKGNSSLILRDAVMSDSGTFGCRNSKEDSITSVLLHVTPGCVNGIEVKADPAQAELGDHFKMSCYKCINKPVDEVFSFSWTLNGREPDSDGTKTIRNTLLLNPVKFNHIGLWSCRLSDDASQHGEYCLELPQKPTRGTPTESPTNATGKESNPSALVIWVVAVAVLLVGAGISIWCIKRRNCRKDRRQDADFKDLKDGRSTSFSRQQSTNSQPARSLEQSSEGAGELQYGTVTHFSQKTKPKSAEEATIYSAVVAK